MKRKETKSRWKEIDDYNRRMRIFMHLTYSPVVLSVINNEQLPSYSSTLINFTYTYIYNVYTARFCFYLSLFQSRTRSSRIFSLSSFTLDTRFTESPETRPLEKRE